VVDPSAAHCTPVEKQLAVPVHADDPIGFDAFSLRVEQDDAVSHRLNATGPKLGDEAIHD
jgi:hypothetical protein